MVKQPLISIVLTTFNRAHFVEEMLSSIQKQTYTNWECIIIDDNSKDNTNLVISNFIKNDKRFTFYIKPNSYKKGLPSSRNIGIEKVKGEFLVFFDDDDVIHKKLLEACITIFLEDQSLSFVHYQKKPFTGDFNNEYFNEAIQNSKTILKDNIYEKIILGKQQIASCTILWKTNLLKQNPFNEDLMYAEEWECYSRIFTLNKLKGIKLDSFLYFNRKHENSNTGQFAENNPIRLNSYIKAHELVSKLLVDNNKLTNKLRKFIFTKSYVLKSKEIVKPILKNNVVNHFLYILFPIKFKMYLFFKNSIKAKK